MIHICCIMLCLAFNDYINAKLKQNPFNSFSKRVLSFINHIPKSFDFLAILMFSFSFENITQNTVIALVSLVLIC